MNLLHEYALVTLRETRKLIAPQGRILAEGVGLELWIEPRNTCSVRSNARTRIVNRIIITVVVHGEQRPNASSQR